MALATLTSSLAAFLLAAAEAAKAFPIWLAWKLAVELNNLDDEILRSNAGSSVDRARLLQLEARHARLSRLYAIVSPAAVAPSSKPELYASDGRGLGEPAGPLGSPRRP
jgi:hypothetical protein